ncbi:GTPase-activating protein pac-1 [Trichinella pseudospiralis]|uniref:GTPase-activating protein pac-1 n=1 Tax=Trichinella pseudospiralis TaxID=6337 RepID=A0A0V1F0T7_TRIPS|nr:GTPase-activating protein pac-1 [Trichinella pseudospiralis]
MNTFSKIYPANGVIIFKARNQCFAAVGRLDLACWKQRNDDSIGDVGKQQEVKEKEQDEKEEEEEDAVDATKDDASLNDSLKLATWKRDLASRSNGLVSSRTVPWCLRRGSVKTGVVSQIVEALRENRKLDENCCCSSSSSSSSAQLGCCYATTSAKDNKYYYYANRRFNNSTITTTTAAAAAAAATVAASDSCLVRTLISLYETGTVDRVGPLKLYHAQMYKRELNRITSHNLGQVLRKAKRFDQLLSGPRRHSLDSNQIFDSFVDNYHNSTTTTTTTNVNGLTDNQGQIRCRAMSTLLDESFPTNRPDVLTCRLRRQQSFIRAVTGNKLLTSDIDTINEYSDHSSSTVNRVYPADGRSKKQSTNRSMPNGNILSSQAAAIQNGRRHSTLKLMDALGKVEVMEKSCLANGNAAIPCSSQTTVPCSARIPVPPGKDQILSPPFVRYRQQGSREKRITRFINFYNSCQDQVDNFTSETCSPSPSCSSSFSDSSCAKPTTLSPCSDSASRSDTVYREGILYHKQVAVENGRRAHDRSWQLYWAFLIDHRMYLCPEKPMLAVPPTALSFDKVANFVREKAALLIDVRSCIADIAYSHLKRKNVFRCITVNQSEHLFQAMDEKDMIGWIAALQSCAVMEETETVSPSSLALIIKHYERQSHSLSPSVKLKKPTTLHRVVTAAKERNTAAAAATTTTTNANLMDDASHDQQTATDLNRDEASAVVASSSSSSSFGQLAHSKLEKGEATLKKVKKWCKTRKAAAGPATVVSSQVNNPKVNAVFGINLEDCVTTGETDFVPLIVQLCVKVVEAYGLDTVGVYRIPGNTAAVNTLSANLDQGFEFVEFDDIRWRDVNVVSSLLKAFFRKLPDPLLTSALYRDFIEANRIESLESRLKAFRELIFKLPKHNFETLKFLLQHLKRVVAHSSVNKMEVKNLALMFGPSLVRPSGENMVTMVTHMSDQCKIVELLLSHSDWIFGSDWSASLDSQSEQTKSLDHSSSNVGELLNLIHHSEKDLDKVKENLARNLQNVKMVKSGYLAPSSSTAQAIQQQQQQCFNTVDYDERNIDEEVARAERLHSLSVECCSPSLLNSRRLSAGVGDPLTISARSSTTNELIQAAEDYRKSREEQIYTARRIFIAGTSAVDSVHNSPPVDSVAKIDGLARHCRHLNVNPNSLDVLSPETREKIKQFQRGHPLWSSSSARTSNNVLATTGLQFTSNNDNKNEVNLRQHNDELIAYSESDVRKKNIDDMLMNRSCQARLAYSANSSKTNTPATISSSGMHDQSGLVESNLSKLISSPAADSASSSSAFLRRHVIMRRPAQLESVSTNREPNKNVKNLPTSPSTAVINTTTTSPSSSSCSSRSTILRNYGQSSFDSAMPVKFSHLLKLNNRKSSSPQAGSGNKRRDARRHTLGNVDCGGIVGVKLSSSSTPSTVTAPTRWSIEAVTGMHGGVGASTTSVECKARQEDDHALKQRCLKRRSVRRSNPNLSSPPLNFDPALQLFLDFFLLLFFSFLFSVLCCSLFTTQLLSESTDCSYVTVKKCNIIVQSNDYKLIFVIFIKVFTIFPTDCFLLLTCTKLHILCLSSVMSKLEIKIKKDNHFHFPHTVGLRENVRNADSKRNGMIRNNENGIFNKSLRHCNGQHGREPFGISGCRINGRYDCQRDGYKCHPQTERNAGSVKYRNMIQKQNTIWAFRKERVCKRRILYLPKLPKHVRKEDIQHVFSKYGTVLQCQILEDVDNCSSLVKMKNGREAFVAQRSLNGSSPIHSLRDGINVVFANRTVINKFKKTSIAVSTITVTRVEASQAGPSNSAVVPLSSEKISDITEIKNRDEFVGYFGRCDNTEKKDCQEIKDNTSENENRTITFTRIDGPTDPYNFSVTDIPAHLNYSQFLEFCKSYGTVDYAVLSKRKYPPALCGCVSFTNMNETSKAAFLKLNGTWFYGKQLKVFQSSCLEILFFKSFICVLVFVTIITSSSSNIIIVAVANFMLFLSTQIRLNSNLMFCCSNVKELAEVVSSTILEHQKMKKSFLISQIYYKIAKGFISHINTFYY